MNIDTYRLRKDLEDYFGTAMFAASPIAMADLIRVQKADDEELIKIAEEEHFDINKYALSHDDYYESR